MAVKYSLDWSQKLKPSKKKSCISCGLYLNQPPVYENANKSQIFWVGLSAVRFNLGVEKLPLSPLTNSGALIEKIEIPLRKHIYFYKTNLVKCLPLKKEKIRYPLKCEMEKCYSNFEDEINILRPSIVFLLGKQVASFVFKKQANKEVNFDKDFQYQGIKKDNILYIPIHHPSYILVYKRKQLDNYVKNIRKLCNQKFPNIIYHTHLTRSIRRQFH